MTRYKFAHPWVRSKEDDVKELFAGLPGFNFRVELWGFLFVASCATGTFNDRIVAALNTTAMNVEVGETTAEMLYETHQQLVLDVSSKENPLPTQDIVSARLALVRQSWDPLWLEFDALRALYEQVTTTLVEEGSRAEDAQKAANEFYQRQVAVARLLEELRGKFNALRKGEPQETRQ